MSSENIKLVIKMSNTVPLELYREAQRDTQRLSNIIKDNNIIIEELNQTISELQEELNDKD